MTTQIVKPASYATYGTNAWTNPGNAIDITTGGDGTTAATAVSTKIKAGTFARGERYYAVPALPAGSYSSKTLYIKTQVTAVDDPGLLEPWLQLYYTLNGTDWVSWAYDIAVDASPVTRSVAVTDETLVEVRVVLTAVGSGGGADPALWLSSSISASVFDIWVEGVGTVNTGSRKKSASVTGF